ncbi:MAG TPA: hypothetical protein VGK73_01305 [Polyangiaceae bacterium]
MTSSGGNQKLDDIAGAAAKVAERLASPEAQGRLKSAAAVSNDRAKAIVESAIIDPAFLKKRVTI